MNNNIERRDWSMKVGRIFDTSPRLGYMNNTVWLPRNAEESALADKLDTEHVHICLDGATGTGKSSVALTMLNRLGIKHVTVQVTSSMDWSQFCRMLVDPESDAELSFDAELEAGIQQGLPLGMFRVKFGRKQRRSENKELFEQSVRTWTEHDVCEKLAKTNTLLLIDDFDRASEDLIKRVAAMCKLLTQTYKNQFSKVLVVGTDDIYRRLYEVDTSLESRLTEISLGTFPDKYASWAFIKMGFDALRLKNPATEKQITKEELDGCIQAVYEAADGLPKSLNELGREISRNGYGRSRISPADIKEVASKMPLNNLRQYRRREFPEIIRCIESNPVVRFVLQMLYNQGVGKIHYWDELIGVAESKYSDAQLDNAINELIQVRFLTRTGRYGEVLFTTNPTLAHTLGVLVSNPKKFNLPENMYGGSGQLKLELFKRDE